MRTEEVEAARSEYSPVAIYKSDPEIRLAIDRIRQNVFSVLKPGLFEPIVRSLLEWGDHYMLLGDMRSYIDTQDAVGRLYADDPYGWARRALVNVARSGRFSSDRTIAEYAHDIWHVTPCD